MKLISMHIDNFGGLHDFDYFFEDGLNIILQDNGWGKTTMAAFLKAMLYGLDSKRTKDITENERRRYLPWQGGKYGGSLVFEAGGTNYKVIRTFGERASSDKTRIINADTNVSARIDPEKIGDEMFRLDANAFQRSIFITQNGLTIDGAASSIHARLNKLVSQANDVSAYDGAIADLTQQIKYYEKTGDRGRLGEIKRQISSSEKQRIRFEYEIKAQDAARVRISYIDELLSKINDELKDKKEKLDIVSGEAKKQEASRQLLAEVDLQLRETQAQLDEIKGELGGNIPDNEELELVRKNDQTISSLQNQLSELQASYADLVKNHNDLMAKYEGRMPSTVQLDEIQNTYSELQGVLSTGDDHPEENSESESFVLIDALNEEETDYVSELKNVISLLPELQTLTDASLNQERAILQDIQNWEGDKKSYYLWASEVKRLQPELDNLADYAPDKIAPSIEKLEQIEGEQKLIDIRKNELAKFSLTADEEKLISNYPEQLPDISGCDSIIDKIRESERCELEKQGLKLRLEGEKSKAESLRISYDQISDVPNEDASSVTEPQKPASTALIAAGVLIIAVGIVLGIIMKPALAAISAIGVILLLLGVTGNNKYKTQLQEYEHYKGEALKREEIKKKKADLSSQLDNVNKTLEEINKQIYELETDQNNKLNTVKEWIKKWTGSDSECTESFVRNLSNEFEKVRKARAKKTTFKELDAFVEEASERIRINRADAELSFPEISGMDNSQALELLKSNEKKYNVANVQYQTALRKEKEVLAELKLTKEEIDASQSPKNRELVEKKKEIEEQLTSNLNRANVILSKIGLYATPDKYAEVIHTAEKMLNEYMHYKERAEERGIRQQKRQQTVEQLENKLNDSLLILGKLYLDLDLPDRLSLVRKDISSENTLKDKIEDNVHTQELVENGLESATKAVNDFIEKYSDQNGEGNDITGVLSKAARCNELTAAIGQLEKQKDSIQSEEHVTSEGESSKEESELRIQISELEERRDSLLVEYTQKSDQIRQADSALEQYSDVANEIGRLYEQKQKAQNTVLMLKKTIQLITMAKENLADRYLSKVEQLFNSYMQVWLNNDAVKGILDIDFNVQIEENDKAHVAEGYSTGYCDLIDFCMRLALVDTLFENEQPFLIMDDPFVNLDEDRLDKALELLNVLAANKQIVYFVCHPIRATETEQDSISREKFVKLAEATRKALGERRIKTFSSVKKKIQKSPRELYKVIETTSALPFSPAKADYVITNNIFSMPFVINTLGIPRDNTYELFFIDAIGHVLNERQILEINNGKLSADRLTFSLNTRDDSGDQYELMIRESGQDDYEVIARIPFKVNLAFTSFDF